MKKYEFSQVKSQATRNWPAIIHRLGNIGDDYLTTTHGPCPKCGGDDRWRTFSDFSQTGGAICNRCGSFPDGFELLRWRLGLPFLEVVAKVADFLGIQPAEAKSKQKSKADISKNLEFETWNEQQIKLWCLKKKPISIEALEKVGARLATYRKKTRVIAIPVHSPDAPQPIGYCIYDISGNKLPVYGPDGSIKEMTKVKIVEGSSAGLMGSLNTGQVIKTEGPTDMLSLLSIDLPSDVGVVCNIFGAGEKPKPEIVQQFRGRTVVVIHDCDRPGQSGAVGSQAGDRRKLGWATSLASVATECRNVVLPYEIVEAHGKDLRDWISDRLFEGTPRSEIYSHLSALIDQSPVIEKPAAVAEVAEANTYIVESEDDPHRLARVNLANYQVNHLGSIRYWREEWWRYKEGHYSKLSNSELEAKLNAAIKYEFDQRYLEKLANGKEVGETKRVTQSLVKNVLAATKSMVVLPSSIEMPCWLPDRSYPHYLSFRNGILDLGAVLNSRPIDECLIDHSPDWFSAVQLSYDFDLEATCPTWLTYIRSVMDGDTERIQLLQEWFGYLLAPANDLQKFMVFEGEGGNGKTVFFAAVESVLGQQNISHVPLEAFAGRFDLGTTIGKAVNIAGDVGELDSVAEGQLKQFTGGDVMHFDRKMLPPISSRPTAKLMCAWNTRPRLRDRSSGLWRRMILIPFNKQITKLDCIRGMDKPSWWNDERAGILNWALVGLDRLLKNGEFTESSTVNLAIDDYRKEANPAAEFLDDALEACEPNSTQAISSDNLYMLYNSWCKAMNARPLGKSKFGKELNRKFPKVVREQYSSGGSRWWGYKGIRFVVSEIAGRSVDGGGF